MRAAIQPLTPGWVAVSVRARHLLARRLGRPAARELARSATLADALAILAGSAYGRLVRADMDLAAAQREVGATVLWHSRILAGWAPPDAVEPMRALAGGFELADVEDRLAYFEGGPPPDPFELGGLATASARVAATQSAPELRAALAATAWGDPGGDDAASIRLGLRFAWARRVIATVEEAAAWAAGAVALLLARELFLAGRPAAALLAHAPAGFGSGWTGAAGPAALRAALPADAAWALEGCESPEELWRAEAGWWQRVEDDAEHLAQSRLGRPAVIAAVTLLGVDGRRVAAALEVAARGDDATEVFEDVA
jgi:hypothetical protein